MKLSQMPISHNVIRNNKKSGLKKQLYYVHKKCSFLALKFANFSHRSDTSFVAKLVIKSNIRNQIIGQNDNFFTPKRL